MITKHIASNQRVRDSEFPHPISLCNVFWHTDIQKYSHRNGIHEIKNLILYIPMYSDSICFNF